MARTSENDAPSNLILQAKYDVSKTTPNRVTQVEKLKFGKGGGVVEIAYTQRRAMAFLRGSLDLDRRIGECEQRICPLINGARGMTEDGQPPHLAVPSDLYAPVEIEAYVCWTVGRGGAWFERKLDPRLSRDEFNAMCVEYAADLVLGPEDDAAILYHYFRLVGRLTADRANATTRRRERAEYRGAFEAESVNHNWFYPDGELLGHVTLFDNPYGPFSNYHF